MDRRATTALAWAGGLALTAVHLGPSPAASPPGGVVFGWLPGELAFRLGWMAAALLYLIWFCRAVWRDDAAAGEPGGPASEGPPRERAAPVRREDAP